MSAWMCLLRCVRIYLHVSGVSLDEHVCAVYIQPLDIRSLLAQVDFDGAYPIEGAKEVGTLMTRYVSRALRPWSGQLGAPGKGAKAAAAISSVADKLKKAVGKSSNATKAKHKALRPSLPHLQLTVEKDWRGIQSIVVSDIGKGLGALS